jgi:hypothetical protein
MYSRTGNSGHVNAEKKKPEAGNMRSSSKNLLFKASALKFTA